MRPHKLLMPTVLFAMLAVVAPRADAQNGASSSTSSSKRPAQEGDSTLDSPTFQSNMELDQHYDKSGIDKQYNKAGLDEHYDKSGFDENYDKSGLDGNYEKSESIK